MLSRPAPRRAYLYAALIVMVVLVRILAVARPLDTRQQPVLFANGTGDRHARVRCTGSAERRPGRRPARVSPSGPGTGDGCVAKPGRTAVGGSVHAVDAGARDRNREVRPCLGLTTEPQLRLSRRVDQSDPSLGDPRFVSSDRIGSELNQISWFSTTPYLSVIVAHFMPKRLVIDPVGNYFWLSCATATANEEAARAVSAEARSLVRIYSCLHR